MYGAISACSLIYSLATAAVLPVHVIGMAEADAMSKLMRDD
jgi:hypothetical protein